MTAEGSARNLADRAKDSLRRGRVDEAAAILRVAREVPVYDPDTLRTLADVALVLNDLPAASEFLAAAIDSRGSETAPQAWHRMLGEISATQGKLGEAIRAFRAVLAASPSDADSWRWLARVLRTAGDLPAAIEACRRAVESAPEDWQALGEFATVLTEVRAFDEASALFDKAAARVGDAPPLIVGRAKLDVQCGRRSEAIVALQGCLTRHPNNVSALATLALALRDERRLDDAVAAFRRVVVLAPDDATSWCGLGRTLLESGRADDALAVARSYLERRPGHAGALSLDVLARMAKGEDEAAGRLLDYDRFVVRQTLPVPEGFADLQSFNAALAALTSTHPTLHRAPVSHATAVGLHSGSLLVEPSALIKSFEATLRAAVSDYSRALPNWPEHPFVSRRQASLALDMWCVVMEGAGHQVPHIHPAAWLSGVYYPRLPDVLRSGEGSAGSLAFGTPDRDFPRRVEPRTVLVRPEEGLLVLFPSYFFHHTIPFDAVGTRISVAFDLIPMN